MLADRYSRRPQPQLPIECNVITKPPYNRSGYIFEITVGMQNVGVGIALHPAIEIHKNHFFQHNEFGVDGNNNYGAFGTLAFNLEPTVIHSNERVCKCYQKRVRYRLRTKLVVSYRSGRRINTVCTKELLSCVPSMSPSPIWRLQMAFATAGWSEGWKWCMDAVSFSAVCYCRASFINFDGEREAWATQRRNKPAIQTTQSVSMAQPSTDPSRPPFHPLVSSCRAGKPSSLISKKQRLHESLAQSMTTRRRKAFTQSRPRHCRAGRHQRAYDTDERVWRHAPREARLVPTVGTAAGSKLGCFSNTPISSAW